MKKTILIAICVLTVFVACNSQKPTIYKAWNFSNIQALDTSKASAADNFAYNLMNRSMHNMKFQFATDKSIKMLDSSGKVLSSGKFDMPDNNSISFSLGDDSATLYKIEGLSNTELNLVDEKEGMVLHLTAE